MQRLRSSLAQWRIARRVVLTSIALSGFMATSLALMVQPMGMTVDQMRNARTLTYSGVGVVIEQVDDRRVMVRHVIPNSPAEGFLKPGMRLVAVDGQTPMTLPEWANAIRGEAGTNVDLTIAHECGGQQQLELTRALVRVEY